MLTLELATKFASAGLVQSGYEVFRGKLPASPDEVIVIYETAGLAPELFFVGTTVEQPGVQIVARGAADDYDGPRLALEKIAQGMRDWGAFMVGSVRYLGARLQQQPYKFDQDANQRVKFAVNAILLKEPSPLS
jgi:hypothetical protein